jgi:tRNA(fMet)-specific endonuclease VapC
MGLVLDSSVLIAAEREAKPVSELLSELREKQGETEIIISTVSISELEHGLHRAVTPEQSQRRRDYLETIYAAIPIQPFTKEMGQLAGKIDAEARKAGAVVPFSICSSVSRRFTSAMPSARAMNDTSGRFQT